MSEQESQVRILLSCHITDDQAKALKDALNLESLEQQISTPDPLIVGTVIVGISFIAKSFFDEFFKEAGKDTNEWLKVKLGLIKAKEQGELKTEYHIHIANIFIEDDRIGDIEHRHDSILQAINSAWEHLTPKDMRVLKLMKLSYDTNMRLYTEAELYDSEVQVIMYGRRFPGPFKIIALTMRE